MTKKTRRPPYDKYEMRALVKLAREKGLPQVADALRWLNHKFDWTYYEYWQNESRVYTENERALDQRLDRVWAEHYETEWQHITKEAA